MNLVKKIFPTLFLSLAVFGGCSSTDVLDSENPEVIFEEAEKLAKDGYYLDAKTHLDEVRRRFPQSRFAVLAELRGADLEYEQENFTEAAVAYGTFVELYPNHKDSAYAQFRKADAYFKDTPENIARDQAPARDAAEAASQLLKRYPGSKYSQEATEIVEKARLRLGEKEGYIAEFYERKDKYDAAYKRWTLLLSNFKDLEKLKDPAAAKLLSQAKERIEALKDKLAELQNEGDS